MTGSPEAPSFNLEAFDASFFANYEKQLAEISVEEQASAALAGIMTIEKADGTQKTYEQLRDETRTFFDNEWVRRDEAVMNRMAIEFAQSCMAHNHGSDLARDSQLGSVFEQGVNSLFGDKRDDKHDSHTHADDEETDPKTGKKKKKKKSVWFDINWA